MRIRILQRRRRLRRRVKRYSENRALRKERQRVFRQNIAPTRFKVRSLVGAIESGPKCNLV